MIEQDRKRSQGKQPITAHPLFPATVALWFGALFGLGGFAVRPALLESLVLAIHLDTVIPAAAPPLGITFRVLFALALAGAGGALGAFVGRAVARRKPDAPERRRGAFSGLRESRTDAPDDAGSWPGAGSRRRALAIQDEETACEVAERAPLPGGPPQILSVADVDLGPLRDEARVPALQALDPTEADVEALDLSDFADQEPDATSDFAALKQSFGESMREEAAAQIAPQSLGRSFEPPAAEVETVPPPVQPLAAEMAAPSAPFAATQVEEAAADAPRSGPAAEPSHGRAFDAPPVFPQSEGSAAEQTVLPAQSVGAESLSDGGWEELAPAEAEPLAARGNDAIPAPEPSSRATFEAPPHWTAADLASLPLEALLERLALSLQRRREAARPAAAIAADSHPADRGCQDAGDPSGPRWEDPEPAPCQAETHDAVFVPRFAATDDAPSEPEPPLALPAALRSISFPDIDEGEDDWLPGFVPPRHIAMPAAAGGSEDAEDDDGVLEAGYASLLGLSQRSPIRQGFVRIEEPEGPEMAMEPVVVFPGSDGASGQARRFDCPEPLDRVSPSPSAAQDGAPSLRPFDDPDEPGAPVKAPSPGPYDPQNRDETERALRAALSNLQRMSGTA